MPRSKCRRSTSTFSSCRKVESLLDPEYTNLAGAMQRAMAMFPHDAAKRIVIVTDGNQNVGDALEQARAMADAGVSIDVMPVPLERAERSVGRKGGAAGRRAARPAVRHARGARQYAARGRGRQGGRRGRFASCARRATARRRWPSRRSRSSRASGCSRFREEIDQPDFYTYEARFVPDDCEQRCADAEQPGHGVHARRGKGQVLLIEDWETAGEFDYLVERLRDEGIEVTVQPSNRLFTSLAELQRYDSVVLANVPRSSGDDAANVSSFTDEQIDMLVRNTEELGCGLIMLGGPNSFGAGGWTNTELEKAMPVDFQIKSAKVMPVGALVLNMHAGEIPQANYWQKVICPGGDQGAGAARLLRPDSLGTAPTNGCGARRKAAWFASGRTAADALADRPDDVGDMPDFDPGMKMAAAGICPAAPTRRSST